jgi:hypothetical protein
MDPDAALDPDPTLFGSGIQDDNGKWVVSKVIFCLFLTIGTLPSVLIRHTFFALGKWEAVFRIRIPIWIRIYRIHMFLGLPDPDPPTIKQK